MAADLDVLVDSLPTAVLVVDSDGAVAGGNARVEALFGRPLVDMVGASALEYVAPEAAWAAAAALSQGLSTGRPLEVGGPRPFVVRSAAGTDTPVDLWWSIVYDGEPPRMRFVFTLTPATVAVWLCQAVEAVISGEDFAVAAEQVCRAIAHEPVGGRAALVRVRPGGFDVVTHHRFPSGIDLTVALATAVATSDRRSLTTVFSDPWTLWLQPLRPRRGSARDVLAIARDRHIAPTATERAAVNEAVATLDAARLAQPDVS